MDPFHQHWLSQQDLPTAAIVTFFVSVSFVLLIFKSVVLDDNEPRPVSFNVPTPKQCDPEWTGEILEEPGIEVVPLLIFS